MLSLLTSKAFVGLLGLVSIAAGVFLFKHSYAISKLENKNKVLTQAIKSKDLTIHNLGVEIIRLIENNKVIGFEEYFNGLSENNTSYSADLLF